MPLNQDQQAAAAAARDLPLKIIAGAGTGKTETLAARYVELVRQGIVPERIALLTFTEDAAAEMRARVTLRLRESGVELAPHLLLNLWISTFHGFAMRLLHEHGFAIGLPPTPRLITEEEQADLWQTIRDTVETTERMPNGYAPLDHAAYRWDTDETWNKALTVIDALRRGGGTPDELAPHPLLSEQQTIDATLERAQLVPLIEHCFAIYTSQLGRQGVLDFDEQLQAALRLLRQMPEIANRFDVVMVDEFQDTNRPQLELLRHLRPDLAQTTVVGDPRQAIYGWNSARAESINDFPFRTGGARTDLTTNYRSHAAIVEVANMALRHSYFDDFPPLEHPEAPEQLRHAALDHRIVSLHLVPCVEDEAELVVAEIRRLHERGMAYRDMAILFRSRTHLSVLRDVLINAGVPFVVNGGTGFYLHRAVRLTSSLLRVIADPADRAAWVHVLESPLINLPASSIAALNEIADSEEEDERSSFVTYMIDPSTLTADLPQRQAIVERLEAFRAFFISARDQWGLMSPASYLEWLWRSSGMLQDIATSHDHHARLVLQRLVRDAEDYARSRPAVGIDGFSALLERLIETQPRVALPTPAATEAVEVATVHQAKGREWPVVFVINSALPGQRAGQVESVLWDEQWKLVISTGTTSDKRSGDPLQQLRDDFRRRKRNEERSIWYVALTRAQQRLYLIHSGCPLNHEQRFDDARAKLDRINSGESPAKDDEAIHFFHELWEHMHDRQDEFGDTVACLGSTI